MSYTSAFEQYAALGVDTETALKTLDAVPISRHCGQGDEGGGTLQGVHTSAQTKCLSSCCRHPSPVCHSARSRQRARKVRTSCSHLHHSSVPQLLNQHHLVIGKAGGATVHEAIAARCPMLIHHLVPGQEEGNLRLLESIGAGSLADAPGDLGNQLSALLSDQAAGWRAMKHALARHDRNAGAIIASRFILKKTMDRGS